MTRARGDLRAGDRRRRGVDAVTCVTWMAHASVGAAIVFALAVALASAGLAPVGMALVPCALVFWQLMVPSEALGRMRANGATSARAVRAVVRRTAGDGAWEFWTSTTRGVDSRGGGKTREVDRMARRRRGGVGGTAALEANRRRLPPLNAWPHRPVFVRSSPRSATQRVTDGWASKRGPVFTAKDKEATIGVEDACAPVNTETAMSFETELFEGRILCRFKGIEDAMTRTPDDFYATKRASFQFLVQGRFKERVKVSDVLTGAEFDREFENKPPRAIVIAGQEFFKRLTPGLIADVLCEEPHYYAPIGATLSVLAAHTPDEAPDITSNIEEETRRFGGAFAKGVSISERCRIFSNPKQSNEYFFNTEDVYTLDYFQNVLLFDDYCLDIGFVKLPLRRCLNGQPISFFAKHRDGRYAYSFEIWHECLLDKAPERTPVGADWPPSK